MKSDLYKLAAQLPIDQRMTLAMRLWRSFEDKDRVVPVTGNDRGIVRACMEDMSENPGGNISEGEFVTGMEGIAAKLKARRRRKAS